MNLNWIKQFESSPYPGQQKQGYTLTYIPHLQSLLLLGGNLTRSNQLYLYNLVSKEWSLQRVSTPKPTNRKYHTAYYDKIIKGVIVYGGEAQKKRSLDCFWVLFIEDWKWRKLAFKSAIPSARQFHTFTSISNDNYLIFGGISLPYQTYLQDLWILKGMDKLKDTKTLQIVGCSCTQITGKGQVPSGRYAHSSYYLNQNLYVIGGQSQKQQQSFTIYNLNMKTMFWYRNSFNINLSQLMGTSLLSNPSNPNQIFIIGGVTSSNKPNNFVYTLAFEDSSSFMNNINRNQKRLKQIDINSKVNLELKKYQKIPYNQMSFDCVCQLPFNQVFGICSYCQDGRMDLYRVQLRQQAEQLGLQQYLKYIKNQQLLSQQLILKVSNLQALYQQIQSFTSKLYKQYQQNQQYNADIEKQKKNQIEACMQLKEQYSEIESLYGRNLGQLAKARRQLAGINEYFQGCIETERDQDQ